MNKKNILLITARSDVGGGPKHVLELAKKINQSYDKDIQLFIASPKDNPHYQNFFKLCHSHFYIPHRSFSFFILLNLIIFCKNNQIDIIHSHGRGAGLYSRALRLFGFTILHSHHGVHPKYKIKNFIEKVLNHFTNQHILISHSEYQTGLGLKIFSQNNSTIIENGIDVCENRSKFTNSSPQELINKYKINNNDINLVTLSRLDYHKGNHLLIKAFLELITRDQNRSFKLFIAGEGDQKEELMEYIKKNHICNKVVLLGNIDNPYELLKLGHIYVSHSLGEGLPYSILEAFCASLPCLLSDVPGHQGLVDKTQLFSIVDNDDFITKAQGLASSNIAGVKNFDHLKKDYSLENQIKKLINLYLSNNKV